MRDFNFPFRPEELLAQQPDGRLWASNIPDVDSWSLDETNGALDSLVGRVMSSHGQDLAEEESFSLVFGLLQAWPRLEVSVHARVADLVADAARRVVADVLRVHKAAKKQKDEQEQSKSLHDARTGAKVAAFFSRWTAERMLRRQAMGEAASGGVGGGGSGRGRGKKTGADSSAEEKREAQKILDRQRTALLTAIADLVVKGSMPWLWAADTAAWQQIAQSVIDAGLLVIDSQDILKNKEIRQVALRCIAEPLMQEGHQLSNLLVTTVSQLVYGLRGTAEGAALFAADVLLFAHGTQLPRTFLVELTQSCTGGELTSQGSFQRAIGTFLVALTDRLPHIVLANISILLPLLDIDCYPLRSAIVESIGGLLTSEGRALPEGARCSAVVVVPTDGANGEDGEDGEKEQDRDEDALVATDTSKFAIAKATKTDLLETLLTRSTDKTVWVRVKVLQALSHLATAKPAPALPRDLWPRVLEIATRRMQDTACSARKVAMQLVRILIERHPYGPALNGSGSERAKAQQLLEEVAKRLHKLQADESREEALKAGAVFDDNGELDEVATSAGVEATLKRRRLTKKNGTEETAAEEVERCLAAEVQPDDESEDQEKTARIRERLSLKRMSECFSQRLRFVELIDAAESCLRNLLGSRTPSDVCEAIGVVVELRLRGLPAAAKAFNQILGLVWSRAGPVKEAAVQAFHRMHLDGRDPIGLVSGLLDLYEQGCSGTGGWTYTHLASVQELIQEAATAKLVEPRRVIPELVAALSRPACPMALRALTTFGAADHTELLKTLPQLSNLFGPNGNAMGASSPVRLERTQLLCHLLQRLHSCTKGPLKGDAWDHIVTLNRQATHVVVDHFARGDLPPQWFGAAQAAIDLSFELAESADPATPAELRCPDLLWEQILERMLRSLSSSEYASSTVESGIAVVGGQGAEAGVIVAVDAAHGSVADGAAVAATPAQSVSSTEYGCALFIAGHLALRMLVFLEGLQAALKRKRMVEEDARMAAQREKGKKAKKGQEPEQDEATSLGAAGEEERENDLFAELCETGLLSGAKAILRRVKPLLLSGLGDPEQRCDPILRRAAALGLCKFMTVSKAFCEDNLPLLFSILFPKGRGILGSLPSAGEAEAAASDVVVGSLVASQSMGELLDDQTLRQSLLVAVGDLLFRHPNVVEPWTDRLYAALSVTGPAADGSEGGPVAELRLTALLVLTHLVLNDMMKPRAVLLVRALWLTACPHVPTSRVARILFTELSRKTSHPIYNLLPFIVGLLPEHRGPPGLANGTADERVRYLMQFIEKEKHVEGLIEKLSIRLVQCADLSGVAGAATTTTQSGGGEEEAEVKSEGHALEIVSCLANALGAMTYTDKCILRLHDVVVVRKSLNVAISYHEVVRDNLLGVVERARKPRGGKVAGDGATGEGDAAGAAAESGPPAKAGGISAAATSALDAIEELVTSLAEGRAEACEASNAAAPIAVPIADSVGDAEATVTSVPDVTARIAAVPTPARGAAGSKTGKRKLAQADIEKPVAAEPAMEACGDEEPTEGKSKGRAAGGKGRGRGKGRGKGGGDAAQETKKVSSKTKTKPERRNKKHAVGDDDDDSVE